MKLFLIFQILFQTFLTVQGFSLINTNPCSQPSYRYQFGTLSQNNINTGIKSISFHSVTSLFESQKDNKNFQTGDDDDDELGDYDFEAGFQARLEQEGGRTGVQVKAAKRSVTKATRDVTGSVRSNVKESRNTLSLLSTSEWYLTVGFLALVVVLAVGTHFSSVEPFETSTNGEQLGFGIR